MKLRDQLEELASRLKGKDRKLCRTAAREIEKLTWAVEDSDFLCQAAISALGKVVK